VGNAVEVALDLMGRGTMVRYSTSVPQLFVPPSKLAVKTGAPAGKPIALYPHKLSLEIKVIRNKLYSTLGNCTFNTVIDPFMPCKAFDYWMTQVSEAQEEFMAIRGDMPRHRDDFASRSSSDCEAAARDAWSAQYPLSQGDPPASFVADFKKRLRSLVPSRLELLDLFGIDTFFYVHPLLVAHTASDKFPPQVAGCIVKWSERMSEMVAWSFIDSVVAGYAKRLQALVHLSKKACMRYRSNLQSVVAKNLYNRACRTAFLNFMDDTAVHVALEDLQKAALACDSVGTYAAAIMLEKGVDKMQSPKLFVENYAIGIRQEKKTDESGLDHL